MLQGVAATEAVRKSISQRAALDGVLAVGGSGGVGCHGCFGSGCFVVVWLLQRLEKYRAKYREKTSSFSTPNRGGFARYLLAVFFADVS